MEITEATQGAVVVVRAVGPLTGPAGERLSARLRALAGPTLGRVVLDLSEVPFADSAGIEALLDYSDALCDIGLTPRICGAGQTLRETLRLTGHAGSFDLHEDATAAARSFL